MTPFRLVFMTWLLNGCFALSSRGYQGPVSDHFDGERFLNEQPTPDRTFSDLWHWQLKGHKAPWPPYIDYPFGPKPLDRVGQGDLRVTLINHATTLIQMDGINVLTDPIWSERASPFSWAGPKRARAAGIRFEDLPKIDVVLISHNHYDHMDIETLQKLESAFDPVFLVGLGNAHYLDGLQNVHELDWGQAHPLTNGMDAVFVPAQHFSSRGLRDRNRSLWGGFVIKSPHGNVYFAGDTGYGPFFRKLGSQFAPLRLSILPIGAYEPRWFMEPMHLNPDDAVLAHLDLKSHQSMGMHYGTFQLTDEAIEDPPKALDLALKTRNLSADKFWVLRFGEGRDVPAVER